MAEGSTTRVRSARPASLLPIPTDARLLAERLAAEERELADRLAILETRVRRFADEERPAYASWRRLTFGPLLASLQELSDELRLRGILARRVSDLVDRDGLHPREALYMVEHPEAWPTRAAGGGFDPDEVEARRRAKRERKRAERREAKRARRSAEASPGVGASHPSSQIDARRERAVDLYRALARRIHPDSPAALRSVAPDRLGALWSDVQDAYEGGSVERLLAIAAWVDTLAATEDGESASDVAERAGAAAARHRGALLSFSERYDRLRALQRSVRALERELVSLRDDPAWDFEAQRHGAEGSLLRRGRAAIDEEIACVRRGLDELEEFFAAIGPPRAPRFARRR